MAQKYLKPIRARRHLQKIMTYEVLKPATVTRCAQQESATKLRGKLHVRPHPALIQQRFITLTALLACAPKGSAAAGGGRCGMVGQVHEPVQQVGLAHVRRERAQLPVRRQAAAGASAAQYPNPTLGFSNPTLGFARCAGHIYTPCNAPHHRPQRGNVVCESECKAALG